MGYGQAFIGKLGPCFRRSGRSWFLERMMRWRDRFLLEGSVTCRTLTRNVSKSTN